MKLFLLAGLLSSLFIHSLAVGSDELSMPMSGIGRGARLVLNRDLTLPANQEFIDLPTRSQAGVKTRLPVGYGIYFEEWDVITHTCRLYFKEKSLDRRLLRKGTEVILSGEYSEEEHDSQTHVVVQALLVSSPEPVYAVACGGYKERFRSLLGDTPRRLSGPQGPALLDAEDFKRIMALIGTLELVPPKEVLSAAD